MKFLRIQPDDRRHLPQLQEALADELYRRSAIPQMLFIPVLCGLYWLLRDVIQVRPAVGWVFVGLAVVLIPRVLSIYAGGWLRRHYPDPRVRVWIFAIGSALVGSGMGLINLLAAPAASVEQILLLGFTAAGINSVNIVSMNPSLRSYFMSMLPNFGTMPLVVMLGPPMQHRTVLLVLILVNFAALTLMAVHVHLYVRRALLLRLKVDDSNAALSHANRQLQSEVAERLAAETTLAQRNRELETLNERLAGAQGQLLQSEKMASIGQLAAGVAHEINNPIAFVRANLHSLDGYVADIIALLAAVDAVPGGLPIAATGTARPIDTRFLREDIPALLSESIEGATRVEKIVRDLREFSHLDDADWQRVDLHKGIESTLNVATHELKYKVQVVRDYGVLPLVECLPFQINQVLLNLLVNAAQAIDGKGTVTLSTGHDVEADAVWIGIADTGKGIEAAHLKRIFEPFFTTKPVGVGTGLGLSVSYSIMRRHGGRIEVTSTVGQGTCFTLWLPVSSARASGTADNS